MTHARKVELSASEDRLEQLIAERLRPGADKARVDERIWDLFGEEWAVMFTDLVGFSSGVSSFGIIHFLQVIHESHRLLIPCIDRHDGILLKIEGDSLMVIFRKVDKAIDCSCEMQRLCQEYTAGCEPAERLALGVGLGFGRLLRIGDRDVFGGEVNAAAKLGEDIAAAHEILVTGAVRDAAGPGRAFEPIAQIPPGASSAFRLIQTGAAG